MRLFLSRRQTADAGLLALPPMTAQIATALGPALDEPVALQQPSTVHVRFGSKADRWPLMSALPPKADMVQHDLNVRFVHDSDISTLGRATTAHPRQ
jgi:hypothetical protein